MCKQRKKLVNSLKIGIGQAFGLAFKTTVVPPASRFQGSSASPL